MKTAAILLIAFAVLVCASTVRAADIKPATPAPANAEKPPKGFDAFRLVKARNIFDPDRRGLPSAQPSRPSAPPRPNFINLTGTMVTEGKTLAFFSGSRTEYSKVISIGDSIADFKITGITNTQVELDRGGKQIVVTVGKGVPLDGSSAAIAPAEISAADTAVTTSDTPATGDTPAAAPPSSESPKPASSSGGDQSDVLKRMMERRQKELGK